MAESKARWAFVAPEAQLIGSAASTTPHGTNGAGPFCQAADGSRIVGKEARVPEVTDYGFFTTL